MSDENMDPGKKAPEKTLPLSITQWLTEKFSDPADNRGSLKEMRLDGLLGRAPKKDRPQGYPQGPSGPYPT